MIALLLFIVLMTLGIWNLFGCFAALGTAGMWAVAAVIAMILGPKYPTKPYVPRKP